MNAHRRAEHGLDVLQSMINKTREGIKGDSPADKARKSKCQELQDVHDSCQMMIKAHIGLIGEVKDMAEKLNHSVLKPSGYVPKELMSDQHKVLQEVANRLRKLQVRIMEVYYSKPSDEEGN